MNGGAWRIVWHKRSQGLGRKTHKPALHCSHQVKGQSAEKRRPGAGGRSDLDPATANTLPTSFFVLQIVLIR